MFDPAHIPALHDQATTHWHTPDLPAPQPTSPLEDLILAQHRANFDLWHHEDDARDPHAPNTRIAQLKRSIDTVNQRRNDLVEQLDTALLTLAGAQSPTAPLHSETPGLIIDRLSILALKLCHTAEQTHRPDATQAHRDRNRDRLAIIQTQRDDLALCLAQLWSDILAGQRRVKLYRQLKMYNDPTLNPVLYRAPAQH